MDIEMDIISFTTKEAAIIWVNEYIATGKSAVREGFDYEGNYIVRYFK